MDEYEDIYKRFVIDKLENAGGCLKFDHIKGHVTQLPSEVGKAVGTGISDVMRFLRKHDDLFAIKQNGTVSLKSSAADYLPNHKSSSEPKSAFPSHLKKHAGIIIKVLPNFGFIASKTLKSTIYFTPACFEGENRLLTDFLVSGEKVLVNARLGDPKFQSKYQATKVWMLEKDENVRPVDPPKFRNCRDTGSYDASTSEGSGEVQKVFEHYGYIIIGSDPKNTAYFTKKAVCNVENVTNLTKVFSKGDEVEYKAYQNPPTERTRWKATKVWLKKQKGNQESQVFKNGERELKKNQSGKVFPSSNGAVVKFGNKFEHLADADSCIFYMHGSRVTDMCWEFTDGDYVVVDVIQIRSAPGWKALLGWVGERPNIELPEDLDLCGYPDGEIDDISETGSFTSKASSVSALSEASHSSGNTKSSTSKNQNPQESSKSKHRNSRNDTKSDVRYATTRSLSRSSGSSQHSKSTVNSFQKAKSFKEHKSSDRIFTNSNSNIHSRFENDSGFESSHYMPRERKDSSNGKASPLYSYDSNDDYEDTAEYSTKKSTLKEDSLKKNKLEKKVYLNWGDSPYPDEENNESDANSGDPYPDEENYESDLDVESTISEMCQETSPFDKNASCKESYQSNYDCDDKREEICASDELNESETNVNTVSETENEHSRMKLTEETFRELTAVENDIESMLDETTNDDISNCEEAQILPYIKRFCEIPGKILKVFYRYAEIENELLKKSTSFFWTDLYVNGRPAPDHFDDLNEVLKEGQTVKLNCIEIVDDSGSCWHKITMVWKGEKPRIKEMTPAEFISENNLVVSVSYDSSEYEVIDASSDNAEQQKPVAPTRKFLTLVEDEEDQPHLVTEPVKPSDGIPSKEPSDGIPLKEPSDSRPPKEPSDSRPSKEPCDSRPFKEPSDEELSDGNVSDEPSDSRQELLCNSDDTLHRATSVNRIQLNEVILEMLTFHEQNASSLVITASDITDYVLNRFGTNSISTTAGANSLCEKESQTETVTVSEDLHSSSVSHEVNLTETSAQTIVTGNVISTSVFTL